MSRKLIVIGVLAALAYIIYRRSKAVVATATVGNDLGTILDIN